MSATSNGKGAAIAAVLAYAVLWGGSTAYLFAKGNEDWFTAVLVMAIFGLAMSGLAWLLTRGADAPAIEVKRPALESGAIIVYLAAVYAILFLGYGMTYARTAVPEGQVQEIVVMALKLAAHVFLPALLLVLLGARLGPLVQLGLAGRRFWRTLIVLGLIILGLLSVISPSLRNIAETGYGPAAQVVVSPKGPYSLVGIAP